MFDIVQLFAEWLKPTVSPVQRDHQNHQWPNHRVFTLFYQAKFKQKLRVVQTQAILYFKSMSEIGGSDIDRF